MAKLSIPQGTRDFGPDVVRKRNYIISTIRKTFELYGFQPLETPAMENTSTLLGKYGEEGDRLIFKILNNGDILGQAQLAKDSRELGLLLCEKSLKYDLTIPFARYVAMNHGKLNLPFRRYQIQPVWRGDRPQAGRYREFYQCDADVIGSNSLINEVELLKIYDTVLTDLQLTGYELRVNNRKILAGLAELVGRPDLMTDITIAIDKLDKIGENGVRQELVERGLTDTETDKAMAFISLTGTNEQKLQRLSELLASSDTGLKGVEELRFVLRNQLASFRVEPQLDLTLARGLNYYTGMIVEVKAPAGVNIGSIGGGGRYDDLTGLFGVPGISGVGISFGLDRIYDVLEKLGLFPASAEESTRVIFFHPGAERLAEVFRYATQVRERGIAVEMYPEDIKQDKQYKYAEKRGIPFIAYVEDNAPDTIFIKDIPGKQRYTVKAGELGDFGF
ncbi:histidine--tRNA ligase [Chitinophaga sp. XS-30]|uniref:histidine--tRNA ligase n=1 Tax=Chitinophaga sp. XS-30 TaxID=2604421 RepID=UPI0011DE4BD7|nr:histidine--tRNA ligase [Chitinophaga sp. XS-30]QEH43780.1 histidine--tRNA ligase [Chitinophaga sp. XS-30]